MLASLVPAWYGLSWLYLIAAIAGGTYFVHRSARLVLEPGPRAAMANFHASLAQLTVLLVGAIVDVAVLG
jgi:protoheme IX farnesyltransferase